MPLVVVYHLTAPTSWQNASHSACLVTLHAWAAKATLSGKSLAILIAWYWLNMKSGNTQAPLCATYTYPGGYTDLRCVSSIPQNLNIEFTYTGFAEQLPLPRLATSLSNCAYSTGCDVALQIKTQTPLGTTSSSSSSSSSQGSSITSAVRFVLDLHTIMLTSRSEHIEFITNKHWKFFQIVE